MRRPLDPTCPDQTPFETGPLLGAVPALVVAFHTDARLLGRALVLRLGEARTLGREDPALGPGGLDDSRLSRRHLEIRWERAGVMVRDLGSTNGSTLNGQPLTTAAMQAGDILGIGRLFFVLRWSVPQAPRPPHPTLVGPSAALALVLQQVDAVAPHPTTALILGETGTGKELVAREIHARSGRSGAFVPVNCGGLSDELLGSELFGHTRGAFSGAAERRKGLALAAEGGTLFLDEIGEAPPRAQVALLRLLQDREVRPVGADRAVQVDVRFVAATHRALSLETPDPGFRSDLVARLSRWVIQVPPLRARREDIVPIALDFARHLTGRPMALQWRLAFRLLSHPWPGNVRELTSAVERLTIEAGAVEELPDAPWLSAPAEPPVAAPNSRPPAPPVRGARPDLDGIRAAVEAAGGNLRAAARDLGVGRSTLYRWLEEAGVDPGALRGGSTDSAKLSTSSTSDH